MLESKFQAEVIKDIKKILPGCIVIKNDANYIQGFPDLTILFGSNWAVLEVKRSDKEPYQPNQEYYLDQLNGMSYAAMICPQNRELIFDELQLALRSGR